MKKPLLSIAICSFAFINAFAQSPCAISLTPTSSEICLGASAALSASGADSYSWSTGDTTRSITITPNVKLSKNSQ